MDKTTIIKNLHLFNQRYKDQGFMFFSLFGSYARGTEDIFSDIDITYKIDHNTFLKMMPLLNLRRQNRLLLY